MSTFKKIYSWLYCSNCISIRLVIWVGSFLLKRKDNLVHSFLSWSRAAPCHQLGSGCPVSRGWPWRASQGRLSLWSVQEWASLTASLRSQGRASCFDGTAESWWCSFLGRKEDSHAMCFSCYSPRFSVPDQNSHQHHTDHREYAPHHRCKRTELSCHVESPSSRSENV